MEVFLDFLFSAKDDDIRKIDLFMFPFSTQIFQSTECKQIKALSLNSRETQSLKLLSNHCYFKRKLKWWTLQTELGAEN